MLSRLSGDGAVRICLSRNRNLHLSNIIMDTLHREEQEEQKNQEEAE